MEDKLNAFIVITSIFEPTEAVVSFSKYKQYNLIVVGDKKTPDSWQCDGADYISVVEQSEMPFELSKILPFNHYCRKMLGYLKAMQFSVDFIIDTDDDNIPKDNWLFPVFEDKFDFVSQDKGFVNIYQLFTSHKIWPRGLPLQLIGTDFHLESEIINRECKVGIWQGLADEDPDVDAIYRLTNDSPCYFDERNPVVLGKGTISPFNTQNTIIRKELFVLMYLPTYVTFRFTDILRGLVAQPIMWLYGYHLGFTNATVVQKRNPHDYMKDFVSEIPMYELGDKVIEIVTNVLQKSESIENNLYKAYEALFKENIVAAAELVTLKAWINDIEKINKNSESLII